MSKSIKVREEVYQELLKMQRPRETFSEEVERLLAIQSKASELTNIIEGQAAYAQWKLKQFQASDSKQADVIGTDLQGNPLIKRPHE